MGQIVSSEKHKHHSAHKHAARHATPRHSTAAVHYPVKPVATDSLYPGSPRVWKDSHNRVVFNSEKMLTEPSWKKSYRAYRKVACKNLPRHACYGGQHSMLKSDPGEARRMTDSLAQVLSASSSPYQAFGYHSPYTSPLPMYGSPFMYSSPPPLSFGYTSIANPSGGLGLKVMNDGRVVHPTEGRVLDLTLSNLVRKASPRA